MIWGRNFLNFSKTLAMQHICRHQYMIKLIKITIKYKRSIYNWQTQPNYWNNIFTGRVKMTLLYWHPNYLCLNVHQLTFDYSTLEAYSSKQNERNKQISDSESWHLEGFTRLRQGYSWTNNIHVQRDVQKHSFIYPCTTLKQVN